MHALRAVLAARTGLLVAAGGGVAELVGLVWDGLRHLVDPGLAAREDLFAFANPAHALLAAGIAICVAGLIWEIAFGTTTSVAERHARTAVGLVLAALIAANAAVVVIGTAVGESRADQHGAASAKVGLNRDDPVLDELRAVARARGLSAALVELEQRAAGDAQVAAAGHDYSHALGEFGMSLHGSPGAAIKQCRSTFLYGCYHGVLHAYFGNKGETRPRDVVGICTLDMGALVRFQCLHGLGHGVYSNLDNDLFRALTYCDGLGTKYERDSCYGGAFMQNIIQAVDELSGRGSAGIGPPSGRAASLRADDPLYPCNAVADRYRSGCYLMQTSAMLLHNGRDYAAAARSCDGAPAAYVRTCFQSLGRDISGDTLRDDDRTAAHCSALPSVNRDDCYVGAVNNLFDAVDRGIPFCRLVPESPKKACYEAVGQQLGFLLSDAASRDRVCAQAEAAYVGACAAKATIRRE